MSNPESTQTSFLIDTFGIKSKDCQGNQSFCYLYYYTTCLLSLCVLQSDDEDDEEVEDEEDDEEEEEDDSSTRALSLSLSPPQLQR